MSSRDEVNVSFEVKDVGGVDFLKVVFGGACQTVKQINLNDETQCQADLKETFLLMAQLMVANDLEIKFVESEEYPREFIYSAMKAYVADLETEVATVAELMKGELSDSRNDKAQSNQGG